MLTPYQFASNSPIQAIDLDGLEAVYKWGEDKNNNSIIQLQVTDQTAIKKTINEIIRNSPIKEINDGYFEPEKHTYLLVMKSSWSRFNDLKRVYTTNPGKLNNNDAATYYAIENPYDNNRLLEKDDGMLIDIDGPYNGAVRFTSVESSTFHFKIKAATLDLGNPLPMSLPGDMNMNLNHPDAGEITFEGFYNQDDKTISFKIENTTSLGNWATALAKCISRSIQEGQWNDVMQNVQNFISANKYDVVQKIHGKDKEPLDDYTPKKY